MKNLIKNKKMLLLKSIALIAIALFSVISVNVYADVNEKKDYSQFDWDTFYEYNVNFWGSCTLGDTNCQSELLMNQKGFYTKLYRILKKWQKKGTYLRDQLIISTVYFDLSPSDFSEGGSYKDRWINDPYVFDSLEETEDEAEMEEDSESYFENEKDTLKLLTRNLLGYNSTCYGIFGDPTKVKHDDGSTTEECLFDGHSPEEFMQITIPKLFGDKTKCAVIHAKKELDYTEFVSEKWGRIFLLGRLFDASYGSSCKKAGEEYPDGTYFELDGTPFESEKNYFDFLLENRYFDAKSHLQTYFNDVFSKINKDNNITDPGQKIRCLYNKNCTNSAEALLGIDALYEQYEDDIAKDRLRIVKQLISILEGYGLEINYFGSSFDSTYSANLIESARNSYFWPIGGSAIEERNGIKYADGEPTSLEIVKQFGYKADAGVHYGIDIKGVSGVTNVISSYNGEVIQVVNNCSDGDTTCNEGYGNSIVISTTNGDFLVYGGLGEIDSSITVGASVKTGQYLGKIGMTGSEGGNVLHYEIRQNGNSIENAIDPTKYLKTDNPRPVGLGGDFSSHVSSLTREEFVNKLKGYCTRIGCREDLQNIFAANAGTVYDESVKNNVNPEFVVVRAIAEGMSPGGGTYNFWGIGCTNENGGCTKYSSLENGIKGFASLSIIKNSNTVADVMSKYAYIGRYWFNPGNSGLGGCYYYPFINEFMSEERRNQVASYCGGGSCLQGGVGSCNPTNDEDQKAYSTWQVSKNMAPIRYNIFGL